MLLVELLFVSWARVRNADFVESAACAGVDGDFPVASGFVILRQLRIFKAL
jgi:hypothetical protein